ncbi:MAG: hypothetical protein GX652_01655 [Burkholderiaceae bacterium]|nr:hypothetical protein [Burkholderiaceae bacterium]
MTPRNRNEGLARRAVRTLAPLLGAVALLCGCASTLTSEVTSFHRLEDGLSGERFVVVPSESQAGSLEFETYAGFVREALVGHGLLDGGIGDSADALRVGMAYSVDGGSSVVGSGTRGEVGIGVGAGTGGFSMGGIGIGFGIPIGGSREATTTWRRTLTVTIDRPRGAGAGRVFEATAVSQGQTAAITPVMQAMVQAIFRDFPGRNGVTRIVEVPLPGQ